MRGLRAIFGDETEVRTFDSPARCISRLDLDQELLAAATERGARFAQVSVAGPAMKAGAVEGVLTGENSVIRARCVIAADGATSRLRRTCGFTPLPAQKRAYAIRRYFQSEFPLEPFFDIFVPLHSGSADLYGYGWVFPLDSHTANIGVGYYRHMQSHSPALTSVLDSFVGELERDESDRYGALRPISQPFGSPVGMGFDKGRCQFQRVLFVGDAARTTDPITGEGIGYAMLSAGLVADAAHTALNGGHGPDWHLDIGIGRELDRQLLRLGQDSDLLRRLAARRLARSGRLTDDREEAPEAPFLKNALRAATRRYRHLSLEGTPVFDSVAKDDREVAGALNSLAASAVAELDTRFPLISEALHRRMCEGDGPIAGTTLLLAVRAARGDLDHQVVTTALAVELLAISTTLLGEVVDRPLGDVAKMNNNFAILAADFLVSRALGCAAPAGAAIAGEIAAVGCSMCEAELSEVGRVPGAQLDRYLEAADHREGELFALAARLGGHIGGVSEDAVEKLDACGRSLGIATRLSGDLSAAASDSRAEPDSTRREGDPEEIAVRCAELSETAREGFLALGLDDSLARICDLPVERARAARVPAETLKSAASI